MQPAAPERDEDMEKEAEEEFQKMYPNADREMDVHAAQLKAQISSKHATICCNLQGKQHFLIVILVYYINFIHNKYLIYNISYVYGLPNLNL